MIGFVKRKPTASVLLLFFAAMILLEQFWPLVHPANHGQVGGHDAAQAPWETTIFWVISAFLTFAIVAARPLRQAVGDLLTQKIEREQQRLAIAEQEKKRAREQFMIYEQKRLAIPQEVDAMLARARAEAKQAREKALKRQQQAIQRREEQLNMRLKLARQKALEAIRDEAMQQAQAAAAQLLAAHLTPAQREAMHEAHLASFVEEVRAEAA